VDDDADFSSPERDKATTKPEYTPATGLDGGVYYWRVRASNGTGVGAWSATWAFTASALSPPAFKLYLPVVVRDRP